MPRAQRSGAPVAPAAFVILGALLACDPPDPPPSPSATPTQAASPTPRDPVDAARAVLERVVRERCLTPEAEPWALVHGLLVAGAEAQVGGRSAVDRLVGENVAFDDSGRPGFPKQRDGRLVEPHPGTFVKVLLELGVDPQRRFQVQGRSLTLAELAAAVAQRVQPGAGPLPFHNQAWELEVLAALASDDPARRGELEALRARALRVLAENQAYLRRYLGPDAPPYQKPYVTVDGRPAPAEIHRYFCGGLHLFQAVQRLHGDDVPPALAEQYALLRARIRLEGDYWDAKAAQALARFEGQQALQHQQLIGSQQLKLVGHALETLLRARVQGALPADPELDADIAAGFERLAATVHRLQSLGVFDRLDAVRAQAPQVYLDLVGDSAHALHAYVLRDRLN